MPAWISGDVQNLSEGEEFISEEDSQKRIIIIFLVLSAFLNSFATSFTVICMKLSNSPMAKNEWLTPDLGKQLQGSSYNAVLHSHGFFSIRIFP